MTKYFSIHLYDVEIGARSQPLARTLDEFAQLPLDRRDRDGIRLDRVDLVGPDAVLRREAYHLDFAKSRRIGPGRMSASQPIADVGLQASELFGEETAALFLPSKNWLLVMHNHYGAGPSRMAAYFNALDPGNADRHFDYQVRPRIDRDAMRKMQAMPSFSHVEVIANVGAFDDAPDVVGESVHDAASEAKAMRVQLKLMANPLHGRGGKLDRGLIGRFIGGMLRNSEAVSKIEVKTSDEGLDAADRVVELIEQRVRKRYRESELTVSNHRYTYASKIDVLRRACRGWLDSMG